MQLAAVLAAVAVIATVVAILVGDSSSTNVLSRARDASEKAGSYRFTLTQGITGAPAGAQQSSFVMTGVVDTRTDLSRLVLSTNAQTLGVDCTYVASGDTYYTSVHPTRRSQLGAPWVRSDADAVLAGGAFQFRPDQLYADPEGAFDSLKRSGVAKVRGVDTTTYRGDLDLAALTRSQRASPLPDAADVEIPTIVAIDAQGRLRRLTFDLQPSGTTQTTVKFTSTMDLYDYGEDAEIEVPKDAKAGTPAEAATACFPLAG